MLAVLLLNRMTLNRRVVRKRKISKPLKVEFKIPEEVLCRTCLSPQNLEAIFTSKDHAKKRTEELYVVTGLEIKMDDGLSQKMCRSCVETIDGVLEFRRTSKRTEKALLAIAGRKAKKKYKLRSKVSKSAKSVETKDENADGYGYEVGVEYLNDDYVDDGVQDDMDHNDKYQGAACQDDVYQSDVYQDPEYDTAKDEGNAVEAKTKPAAKAPRKRQAMAMMPPYKCNTCNKEFRMKATYKAHMRFHTNYCVCETCGKRCRNNNQLQEHKRARHGLGRIHKCAYCDYSSATKEALTIHERRHTGERPYVCDHCGTTFHRRSNLVQHIAIHLPEKNFQCDMCPKRLKSRKFLQIHKHNAHTGRRYGYLCAVCDHRFEKPNKVRAHARRVHGLPDDQQGPIVRVQL